LFTIGIVAASFSSADSALTALTTSVCVDFFERPGDERLRKRAHMAIAAIFVAFILLFRAVNSTSVIDAIYILCGYTYGPLLGLFAFGLLTHRAVNDRWVPAVAIASPLLCFAIETTTRHFTGYQFGYELLMLNGVLTFAGLWMLMPKNESLRKK
ncbi:MAG TPA: sodium:solute symporter, partial [Prevotella sp.]|nr:sodium:solute symporter [Prevotella sp.]